MTLRRTRSGEEFVELRPLVQLTADDACAALAISPSWTPRWGRPSRARIRRLVVDSLLHHGHGRDWYDDIAALWTDTEWDQRLRDAGPLVHAAFGFTPKPSDIPPSAEDSGE